MAEMVYRRRRKRRVRMLDERRFVLPMPTQAQAVRALRAAGAATPGFLLALTQLLDMPPCLYAAYAASLAALQRPVRWPLVGAGAAIVLRWLCGLESHWEALITLAILLAGPFVLQERGNGWLMAFTAGALLPMAIRGCLAPTAREMILALGALALSTLCAPVFCRGLKALTARGCDGRPLPMDGMEDQLGVAMLALMICSGGAHLLAVGINIGMAMTAAGVLLLGLHFGAGVGCAAGIIAGLCMSLTGLPMLLSVSLAAGGFLTGVMRATGRRGLCCGAFAASALTPLLITGSASMGCGVGVIAASAGVLLMPEPLRMRLENQLQRLRRDCTHAGNAYAACMLAAWEKTVDAMAMSVPSPVRQERPRDAAWWTSRLCGGCAQSEGCPGIATAAAVERVESVWDYHEAEEAVWQSALEGLRGLGCQRLYQLREGMEALRQEDAVHRRHVRHALEQREMLVTHLTAMAGAARRFAHLSQGESWWDALMARRIRQALSEAAFPARLMWLRRVQGHVQAAFALQEITGVRQLAQELCELVGAAAGVMMMTAAVDGERVRLAERPPLEAECGVATACIGGQRVCGDTAWYGVLQDGRFMAAASDGMGHGEEAALSSRQTVELLRLCLDAGYTLQQTLTAVNGMMLLGGTGERFITVDLLTIDLWTGQALLEKLGAAGTWLQQQGTLTCLTGDALPIGILESVQSGESMLRLQPGDAMVLLTDGVEEAFPDRGLLQDAVVLALTEEDPACAAQSLLDAALRVCDGIRNDDQTVLVIRLHSVQKGETGV